MQLDPTVCITGRVLEDRSRCGRHTDAACADNSQLFTASATVVVVVVVVEIAVVSGLRLVVLVVVE